MGASTRSVRLVAGLIDPDDLRDSEQVAETLGLTSHRAVAVYRRRYPDFPEPVFEHGRTVLWLAPHIDAWRTAHPARPRRTP